MALPTSRDITCVAGTPISSALLNKLQDMAIGGKHGAVTTIHSAVGAGALVGFVSTTILAPAFPVLQCPTTTVGTAWFALTALPVGARVTAVRLVVLASSGAASDISALLDQISAPVGVALGSIVTTNPVATVNSAATVNTQTITLTPASPVVITASDMLAVRIGAANSAGTKTIFRVEVDHSNP